MKPFGGIEQEYTLFSKANILLQSIPYDGTSTWGKGADKGFEAFMEACENMELYDIETNSEVFKKGIHILPGIVAEETPEKMFDGIYRSTKKLLELNKFLTFFGGEHSISIGIIKAFTEAYSDLTVVQLDAHADLRDRYEGSKYNHACALHQASLNTNLIQIGIRSMDVSETKYFKKDNAFLAQDIAGKNDWIKQAIDKMTDKVYLTIDLDVFDPSIMPSTGTPEPGGLGWYETLTFLKELFKAKKVLGFDIVELAPITDLKAPNFLAAKLYYKLLSYKFKYNEQ
ncbi:agmatinase [Saccharicrinis sp. GN24d3]|uniref:agmatinase n=1 Tax=Saccharicrinis sp. GN24d3 TaxID=3458416 RepID=UPI0040370C48